MFSPCVFVCVCVVVYVCHDVCPDDLTMKDWWHAKNILQVHCCGCLVVQVMFHALMTSLMTSQDHKVGHILKLIYLRQYLSYSVDQKLKMSEMLMAIFLVYSTAGTTSGKKSLLRAQNCGHFGNFEILNTASIWPQIWKDRPKICQKKSFHDDDVIDDVTGWPQSRPSIFLYEWNNNIFHDNYKTSKDFIIKLPVVHRYHEIMTTIIWIFIHDVFDDVTRLQNRSIFLIVISPSIFELERRSKAQNFGNAHGYFSGIFNFRYNFR